MALRPRRPGVMDGKQKPERQAQSSNSRTEGQDGAGSDHFQTGHGACRKGQKGRRCGPGYVARGRARAAASPRELVTVCCISCEACPTGGAGCIRRETQVLRPILHTQWRRRGRLAGWLAGWLARGWLAGRSAMQARGGEYGRQSTCVQWWSGMGYKHVDGRDWPQ